MVSSVMFVTYDRLSIKESYVLCYLRQYSESFQKFFINGEFLYLLDYRKMVDDIPLISIKPNTFYKIIKRLVAEGFIEIIKVDPESVIEILKKKNLFGKGIGYIMCFWCRVYCVIAHKHHHPVTKKDGGKKTVDICGNCHSEYHNLLTSKLFRICQ
jgi:hypothetical protein